MQAEKKKKIIIYIAFALIMVGLGASDSMRGIFAGIFEEHFDLTMSRVSLIVTVSYIGNLVFILFGSRLFDRFDKKRVAFFVMLMWGLSLLLYIFTDNYICLLIGMFVSMGTSTLMNTLINVMSPVFFGTAAGMIVNTLYFTQGIGTSANQNITGQLATDYSSFKIVNVILLVFGALGTLLMLTVSFTDGEEKDTAKDGNKEPVKTGKAGVTATILKNPAFYLFIFVFGFYFIAEHGIMNWWKTYLEKCLSFDTKSAAVYLSIFFGGMTIGRLVFSPFVSKLGEGKAMFIFGGVGTLLYIAGILGGNATVALLSASGLFISIIYPTMVLFISRFFDRSMIATATGYIISIATLFDIGFNAAFGKCADVLGFEKVILVFPVSLAVFYILFLILKTKKQKAV